MEPNSTPDFGSFNVHSPPTHSTMVTRTTEETSQINGINCIHRRTETLPASSVADISRNAVQQQSSGFQVTNFIPESIGSRFSTYLSGIVSSLATRFPNFGEVTTARSRERWTLRILTGYTNERHEDVNDSMELQFGSREAAEKYLEKFQKDMMLSGKVIPCTMQIFKGNQPPPPSTFSNIPQ